MHLMDCGFRVPLAVGCSHLANISIRVPVAPTHHIAHLTVADPLGAPSHAHHAALTRIAAAGVVLALSRSAYLAAVASVKDVSSCTNGDWTGARVAPSEAAGTVYGSSEVKSTEK